MTEKLLSRERLDALRTEAERFAGDPASELPWAYGYVRDLLAHIAALEKERDGMRSEAVGAIKAMIELLGIIGANPDEPAADAARRMVAERDTALADNAAKDEALAAYIEFHGAEHEEDDCPEDDTCTCPHLVALNAAFGPPHPGAALLEEVEALRAFAATAHGHEAWESLKAAHRKALVRAGEEGHQEGRRHAICEMMDRLGFDSVVAFKDSTQTEAMLADALWAHVHWLEVRARNEGLEEAAALADGRKANHMHNRTPCGPCTEDYVLAELIRAKKEPEPTELA